MKIKEEELRAEVSRLQSEVSRLGEGNALLGSAKSGGNGASAAMAPGSAKGRRRKKMQSAEKVLEEAWASLEEASVAGVRRGGDAGVGELGLKDCQSKQKMVTQEIFFKIPDNGRAMSDLGLTGIQAIPPQYLSFDTCTTSNKPSTKPTHPSQTSQNP